MLAVVTSRDGARIAYESRGARTVPTNLAQVGLPVVAINSEDSQTDRESMRRCGVDVVQLPGVGRIKRFRAGELDTAKRWITSGE